MDLSTSYLGMTLRTPLVPSAAPLSYDLDNIRMMEDAGASAVVLHPLFEEQLRLETHELHHHLSNHTNSFAEALTFFPEPAYFQLGPESYLKLISDSRKAVDIPIIASLNGTSLGGWTDFAKQMEEAGANAIELNIYTIPTDIEITSSEVEETVEGIVVSVKSVVKIPVAVRLSPYYSNMANMARRLDEAGANALVIFNTFHQPDIDLEALEIRPRILLSTPQASRLPLTWIGILYGRVGVDLAATSGIQSEKDVLKMVMVGANVTMFCSSLMNKGMDYIRTMEEGLVKWMEEHEYESFNQMRGSMSQKNCSDPSAFERAQYMRAIERYLLT